MENTIGDFWRMVWQEKSPYIFMLISRKDESRCARYWPRLEPFGPVLDCKYAEREWKSIFAEYCCLGTLVKKTKKKGNL